MNIHEQMEKIYQDIPLDNIPWNISEPPAILTKTIETGKIQPCKVVDLGCGAGNYAVWLAQKGFDVTGIDISEQAIKYANDLAIQKGVTCRFLAADLLEALKEFHNQFDFAYDWEVMHHIFPEDRKRYLQNVHAMLRPNSMYFSLCFSEQNAEFGGKGKYRRTPLGTTLYFSSEDELRELFDPLFDIIELKTIEIMGKYGPHLVNIAWLNHK